MYTQPELGMCGNVIMLTIDFAEDFLFTMSSSYEWRKWEFKYYFKYLYELLHAGF